MARLNTRSSSIGATRLGSETPSAIHMSVNGSDEENQDPRRHGSRKLSKMNDTSRGVGERTPLRNTTNTSTTQKRKRDGGAPGCDTVEGEEDGEDQSKRYYDTNQDPGLRRDVKRASRALERDFNEKREELLRGDGIALIETVDRANHIFKKVKQTSDATVDSRLLVNVSDLGKKKAAQMVLGDTSTGVDIDEFVSRCVRFLRSGPSRSSHAQSQSLQGRSNTYQNRDSDDDEAGNGEVLDWAHLGRRVCFPGNRRPPVPTFLLGPLSVEKKVRTQTQRRARQAKDTSTKEARPEAISREDLSQSDENGLTAICTKIRSRLASHLENAESALAQAGIQTQEDLDSDRGRALLKKHRLSNNGAVPLFNFVVNPRSFGQTVENLFYVSFLIKEGSLGIDPDADGLPTLSPAKPSTLEEQQQRAAERSRTGGRGSKASRSNKHQAVLALDYATWQQLIEAFEIQEPMIPHRHEEAATQLGSRGWYT